MKLPSENYNYSIKGYEPPKSVKGSVKNSLNH